MPVTRHPPLQDLLERRLGFVPDLEVSHPLLRVARGESDLVREAKGFVHGIEEVERVLDLLLDLVDRTEDVRYAAQLGRARTTKRQPAGEDMGSSLPSS